MAWNRNPQDESPTPVAEKSRGKGGGRVSTLGPSIAIRGDLTGAEDLRIEGSIEGTIRLAQHSILVASGGRIQADIFARSICVEGEVDGNLNGEEEVIIRPSGRLEGNITAPSVTLENGAKFRGSIDMEPASRRPQRTDEAPAAAKATADPPKRKGAGAPTVAPAPAEG